jgi:hypothetical protein
MVTLSLVWNTQYTMSGTSQVFCLESNWETILGYCRFIVIVINNEGESNCQAIAKVFATYSDDYTQEPIFVDRSRILFSCKLLFDISFYI